MSNTFINGESQASIRAKLNANTLEVEDRVIGRRYASTQKNLETPDTVTVSAGEINTYKLLPLTFDQTLLNGFTSITNGIKYTNAETRIFEFHGISSVQATVLNTTVHFRIAVNGVTVASTTSATKLTSTDAINTLAGVILIELDQDDELKVYMMADKACTVSAFHTSLTLVEV